MNKSNNRLNDVLKHIGLTQKQLADDMGTSQSAISALVKGSRPISEGFASRIETNYGINAQWLLTGNGKMLKSDTLYNISDGENFRLVPLINIDSVGGIHSENLITADEQYIIKMMPFTEAREGDVAILQSGNSMYPTIPPGSALLIREVVDWQEYFGYGNIYVLLLRDGRRITKEIRRYDADPKNYVWCVSYNPDVADEELPRSMIRGVWKVVKYIADFGW